ncbi:MAG TPA: folylpolyglutamate synthase/dihydrofolate synthase family protein [Thermoplasmata archaeon]|nr:folylpolyglutamate synthase/dihydrofolate synthase family protein [Thermoplasmata archaeon]
MDIESLLNELYALERFGIKLGLDVVRELLRRIGNPQDEFATIHVTGTNGKGSTCAFLASIFRAAGHRVGLYTSPHLVKFNERIRVDGAMIADGDVARLYGEIKPQAAAMAANDETNQPTFFEITTAMAFRYFAERRVDLAVVEVGMGGRLDATNVIAPEACVITRIGLEHTEHLGRTVERIAREKSGIIKAGVPVVTVEQPALSVIAAKAEELHCPLTVVGRDVRYTRLGFDVEGQDLRLENELTVEARIPLLGAFQPENAALAFAAALAVKARWKLTKASIAKGLSAAEWPGRLQVVRRHPTVIVDGAHNAPAAAALADSLQELFPGRKVTFVLGILNDKDLRGIAEALGPLASRVIAARPKTPRAFEPEDVKRAFQAYASVDLAPGVKDAVRGTVDAAAKDDVIVVAGSIYTAGEALEFLGGWE